MLRIHGATISRWKSGEERERERKREKAHTHFFKRAYATAALIKFHSPPRQIMVQEGGRWNVCLLYGSVRFCIRRIYAELPAACLIQCPWSYRDRRFNHVAKLRFCSARPPIVLHESTCSYSNIWIPWLCMLYGICLYEKCKINCYLIYMTIFRLLRYLRLITFGVFSLALYSIYCVPFQITNFPAITRIEIKQM